LDTDRRPPSILAVLLLGGLAGAAAPAPAPPDAAPTAPSGANTTPRSPAELRNLFEKAERLLRKAADAATGRDAGRVSLLLRRADEEIARFQDASGLETLVEAVAASRDEALRNELPAAQATLRSGRAWIGSLSDYTVPRSAEVAFRAAESAAADGLPEEFTAALDRFEAATLSTVLLARVRETREALARGRALLVKNDLKGAGREVDAARAGLDGLTYAGALSRSRYLLLVASELLRDKALLAARDLSQKGLRELRTAIGLAPEPAQEPLRRAQEEATTVWRRMNKPVEGDADILAASSASVEEIRQQLPAFRPGGVVAK
jgi:hypothetical protein